MHEVYRIRKIRLLDLLKYESNTLALSTQFLIQSQGVSQAAFQTFLGDVVLVDYWLQYFTGYDRCCRLFSAHRLPIMFLPIVGNEIAYTAYFVHLQTQPHYSLPRHFENFHFEQA